MSENRATSQQEKASLRRLAMILFLAGVLLLSIHYVFLKKQPVKGYENWLVHIDVSYPVEQPDAVLSIQPPYESENARLVRRSISHAGLRLMPSSSRDISKRAIRLRAKKPGVYQVGAEFLIQHSQSPNFHTVTARPLIARNREFFLADNEWLKLDDPLLEARLIELGLNNAEQEKLPDIIFQFVDRMARSRSVELRSAPDILVSRSASHRERALLMVALCRKAGFPARVITGLELKDDPSASPLYWVEVHINDRWFKYKPGSGFNNNLPDNYVALDKFGDGIVSSMTPELNAASVNNALEYEIAIERIPYNDITPDNTRDEWYQVFILDRLSADTRAQLGLLLLLPVGALFCSLIRQLGGLHSYGVFTPTILALAITYADKITTLLILVITLSLVYFGRPTFHQEMSRTPRLSIIYTLVATSIVIGVSILDYFSMVTDGHLVLLPIVIITTLIDRLFSTMESHGHRTAFIRLMWTFVLTLSVVPVLQLNQLGELILRYPELHLFTLSSLILVASLPFGKYKIEKWLVFLAEPENQNKKLRKKSKHSSDE